MTTRRARAQCSVGAGWICGLAAVPTGDGGFARKRCLLDLFGASRMALQRQVFVLTCASAASFFLLGAAGP